MRILYLILAVLTIMSVSYACTSETQDDCEEAYLQSFNMKRYRGETIECGKSYLILYESGDSRFAIIHNDCADLVPQMVVDCEGREICVYLTEPGCFELVQNATNVGVIGVQR